MRRYLFGPVSSPFAEHHLSRPRQAGECLTFGPDGGVDIRIGPSDTWEDVCGRLPTGWRPDFVVLYLPYAHLPPGVVSAPLPVVGLALDWHLLWHYYRRRLPSCDLVLADALGAELLRRDGFEAVRPVNLQGCERSLIDAPAPDGPRDIDILFVGNVNPAIHAGRLPWLARLAALARRWRVCVRSGVSPENYRHMLRRARVVFNFSGRGRCGRRAFEAAAAGALLFREADNREAAEFFRDRSECVVYRDDNLDTLLEHYLEHEDERRAIADAARAVAERNTFERQWDGAVAAIEGDWADLLERSRRRVAGEAEALHTRVWQALASPPRADAALAGDLERALSARPHDADLHHVLGLALSRSVAEGTGVAAMAETAAAHFRRALMVQPAHLMAGLNLAEALAVYDTKEATDVARRALAAVECVPDADARGLDAPHFEPGYGPFRVEWERAAWGNVGDPAAEARAKRELLRWQLQGLLGRLTGHVSHHYEAVMTRPDLWLTRTQLAGALTSAGQPLEALPHLRRAAAQNPFDRPAAAALFQTLGAIGDRAGQARFAASRRLLARAAPQLVPAEPWFAEPPPAADDLASLIVLCCNEVECTRLCLESVLPHTRPSFELILVDNGSTDGTAEYLEEVRARAAARSVRVHVVRNETNRGYPAGVNQGLAQARGRFVVLLNNDTVVTPGWLDGLVSRALHDWPAVGLVGAVTNAAPDPQGIPVTYRDLDGVNDFAARRHAEHAGRWLSVRRLSGFCLLARRDVLEQIGGLDERYGVGFFDDDDLGLRALDAGYRLVVALDVFVHHFGSRTFHGLGIDTRARLTENFELFKAKWGSEHTAGYHLPPRIEDRGSRIEDGALKVEGRGDTASPSVDPRSSILDPRSSARVSLCMIVKNEEERLGTCLGSAADLFDEIIVVDTGSTDRTKEIAESFGARVFELPWPDSFAAARNECLRHATGRWILWLDGDDRLDEDNRRRLRELFASLGDERDAYAMKVRSVLDGAGTAFRILDQVRLFPNHAEIRWEYRVHEQILPAVKRRGGSVRWADATVDHGGYAEAATRRRKLERNLRLLELDNVDRPDDPFTLFNLGWTSMDLGRTEYALPLLRRSLERSAPDSSIVRKLYALIVQAHRLLGQRDEALEVCRAGLDRFPDDSELLFDRATMAWDEKDWGEAEAHLLRLVEVRPGQYFASVDDGVRGYRTRHLLGNLYRDRGRLSEAEIQYRASLAERPGFVPGWLSLSELLLRQERWAELERALLALESGGGALDAAVLRGRAALTRGEFAAAGRVLEEALERFPEAIGPRVILTHALLQEGRDPAAAEAALREVLRRDPAHAETRHNLTVFLQRHGRPAEAGRVNEEAVAALFRQTCEQSPEWREWLPALHELGRECRHITAVGARGGASALALLHARPDKLVCIDDVRTAQWEVLHTMAGGTECVFSLAGGPVEEETDLLFIEGAGGDAPAAREWQQAAAKARRYIVLRDRLSGGDGLAGPEMPPELGAFLPQTFRVKERPQRGSTGLTVLERC